MRSLTRTLGVNDQPEASFNFKLRRLLQLSTVKSTADMHGRRAVLACRAAGRPRTPRPQARRPQSRCQPDLVTDELRPTNHSGMPSALQTSERGIRYSPAGPQAEPGPPGRRPGGPSRGTNRTS